MEKGVIYEGSSFKNLNEVDLCEISGGGIDPVLVAGACMIGVAGAGPLRLCWSGNIHLGIL
ncbi:MULTISPECIES: hypothetical protein [Streptococcus]|jgi:hypothetical protein|uniref:hypothetical protein n=1 Tax=Streptococcus TaxID=1301 RepID=UPI0008802A47|nr:MULTISPECIES: hypothetical protein [Streptococcus]TDE68055.1 hypothetical protein E0E02_04955 [Streptococcus sp. KCJ4932]SDQ35831.1 hypothetical protein SAMN05216407_1213 [Streptococcus equinus]SFR70701.1 hypothetical protein SAMN05216416_0896 [Streptococcus equinus]